MVKLKRAKIMPRKSYALTKSVAKVGKFHTMERTSSITFSSVLWICKWHFSALVPHPESACDRGWFRNNALQIVLLWVSKQIRGRPTGFGVVKCSRCCNNWIKIFRNLLERECWPTLGWAQLDVPAKKHLMLPASHFWAHLDCPVNTLAAELNVFNLSST